MIQLGDNEKEVDLDSLMSKLVGTQLSDTDIQKKYKLDDSELEELMMHFAGNIERCNNCKKWTYTYDVYNDNTCAICPTDEDNFMANRFKQI